MMWEALREAIDEEMERDTAVCVMGEDVGHYGGSYKVSGSHADSTRVCVCVQMYKSSPYLMDNDNAGDLRPIQKVW